MNEEWKFVAGTNEKWQVSNLGRAAKHGKIISKKRIHAILGLRYNVCPETISMAVRGKTWKRLQPEVAN